MSDSPPLQFSNEGKIRQQMLRRRWTDIQLREALSMAGVAALGKNGPATRYVHPVTGKSVIVDNATGEIFHVGGEGYTYE